MPYRKHQRAPLAEWMVRERDRRGWKAVEVARRLRELGLAAEDSTYRTWEAGRTPAPETIAALEQIYESIAPSEDEESVGDLASAINGLVVELRAWREEDRVRIEALEETVADLLRRSLPSSEAAGAPARPARRVKAG